MTTEATTTADDDHVLVAPASYAQRRLWLMEQLEEDVSILNLRMGLRFSGTLSLTALRRALREVLRRHEVLRTNLVVEDGELVQLINPVADPRLRVTDVSDDADPEAAWERFAEQELRKPFDIATDLPIRADLLRLRRDEHVLVLTLAHAACDAWSLRVLHAELAALYPAFADGRQAPLPELPVQYADFSQWQREWLSGGEEARQLDYWGSALSDAPRLALRRAGTTGDRPRTGRSSTHVLPEGLVRRLTDFVAAEGASLFSAVLAGFAAVLARHAGQDEFVVGSLLAGRTQPEVEPLIGFFVNSVGLRLDLSGAPSFRTLLDRVHEVTLDAQAHQDVPFERVVEALDVPSAEPLFNVMFQLADLSRDTVRTPDVTLAPIAMMSQPAPVDLVVAVIVENGEYECVWDYQDDLFEPGAITALQSHFVTLLRAAVADPDMSVTDLDMVTDAERHQLTVGWNTSAEHDSSWCLPCRVGEFALAQPSALAVYADGRRLSYADLERRANQLSHVLRARGVVADTLVGICLTPGVDQLVAMLAVLKAGGAHLPLDPTYPAQRLAYMLTDSAPPLVLASGATRDRVGDVDTASVVLLDAIAPELARHPDTPLPCAADPDHLAYVIYTSGSTGLPKGTAVPRRGLGVIARSQQQLFGLTREDRVLRFAAFSFDASVFEILMAWGVGAGLYVPPVDDGIATDLAGFLAQQRITAVVLPPTALAAMVGDVPLPHLRLVTVAGEACPPALAARWSREHRFLNLYGPTEATIWSTLQEVTAESAGTVPIGRALPGLVAYVLTGTGDLAPIGVPGELHVGGPVLARGYLGRPALTAERFVPDPFGGGRLYRTGDLVRWNADGTLEFVGRIDDQVKIRGFRVELGEVEARLGAHPRIAESVVVVRDTGSAQALVGYYTAGDAPAIDDSELRDWCAVRLPGYMVPAHFVRISHVPTNPSGKIDRKELAGRLLAAPAPAVATRPTNPLEQAIGEVWTEVLDGHPVVGADGNFFELGGNSLSATRVIIRLRTEFGVDLPIRTLFGSPVLAEFTAAFRDIATAVR